MAPLPIGVAVREPRRGDEEEGETLLFRASLAVPMEAWAGDCCPSGGFVAAEEEDGLPAIAMGSKAAAAADGSGPITSVSNCRMSGSAIFFTLSASSLFSPPSSPPTPPAAAAPTIPISSKSCRALSVCVPQCTRRPSAALALRRLSSSCRSRNGSTYPSRSWLARRSFSYAA